MQVHPHVMVVGGGIAGIEAALKIADSGRKVYLVEREPTIGGHMAQFDKCFPTLDCAACILTPKMTQVRAHPNIELLTYSEVESVEAHDLRNFKVMIRRKARLVHEDTCTGCALCADVCPVSVPSEFDEGLGVRKAIYRPFPQAVPNVFTISRRGTPPCQAACPIHQNAQGYIMLIAQGKFKEALNVILRDNPLPSICGRICTHPCTVHCTRANVDEALNIPGLKRFVTDLFPDYKLPKPATERPGRIAIVGSGPAGLMCAYELRQRGYPVIIYEAERTPGGMLALTIPDYRLPQRILQREIDRIRQMGVEIKLNSRVGKDLTLSQLRKNYDAVFISVGAGIDRKLAVPGEEAQGVISGLELLRQIKRGQQISLGQKVVVIGGGLVAVDAARSAVRLGSQVTLICIESWEEMFARRTEEGRREVDQALAEGVSLVNRWGPKEFKSEGGRLRGVGLKAVLRVFDEQGRFAPEYDAAKTQFQDCDTAIVAIGQAPEIEALAKDGLKLTGRGTIAADPVTLQTNLENVFVGGDCVTGPDVVVNAMYAGKKAAISIDRFLNKQEMRAGREQEGPFRTDYTIDTSGVLLQKQVPMPVIELTRRRTFAEVHTGYTEEMARAEAQRCLDCGICCDCRLCSTVCEAKAIDYNMKDEVREAVVGAIIIATGFKPFDARRIPRYGYGKYPNVYTALEIERMTNASGPTGGEVRLRNGEKPKSVGIIHCVGSRDRNYNWYCSRVCCLYSLKLAHLVKERTGAEVYNFYIDMRTAGKAYEEFYDKMLEEGIHFIRGRVADVSDHAMTPEEEGKLIIRAEDTLIGVIRRVPVDMVILSVGLEPQADADEVRRKFYISCSREGFFLERHPKLAPVSTFTDGIFLAGACQGPKDIADTVAQAGAAAAEALVLIDKGYVELEPNTAYVQEELCSGCKTCIPLCPFSAISFNPEKGVAVINEAACKGCGTCVAACPSGAAQQHLFTDEQIYQEIEGVLSYV